MKDGGVLRQFSDSLVERVHEDDGIDGGVQVLDFDANGAVKGHRERAVEAAAGHAEVLGGVICDFAEADAEEVTDRGGDLRLFRVIEIDAQDQCLEDGLADRRFGRPVLPEPPRKGDPELGDVAGTFCLSQSYAGSSWYPSGLVACFQVEGRELVGRKRYGQIEHEVDFSFRFVELAPQLIWNGCRRISPHNMEVKFPGQIELLPMNAEQVRALSSVPCSDVFSAFWPTEALAIREVANELGKSPASVGEHVATLVGVGLLIQVGERKRRSRTEALYAHKGLITRFVMRDHDWETIEFYLNRFSGQMRLADREHAAAQRAIHVDPSFQDYLAYKWSRVYLSPKNVLKVKQAIEDLQELVRSLSEPAPGTGNGEELVRATLTTMLLPNAGASHKIAEKDLS